MSQQPKYRISPSLLNSFERYLAPDYEGYWWQDDKGGWHKNYDEESDTYHYSYAEVDAMALQEMLDTVNKVESVSEAACKGTALNAVVDWVVGGIAPDPTQTKVAADKGSDTLTVWQKMSKDDHDSEFTASNSFMFPFKRSWVLEVADYFKDALCQVEVFAPLETKYGDVILHGFIDYLRANHVYDLKTTKRYAFGDHAKGWQKHVYPYALLKTGMVTDVQDFEYTVFVWHGGTKYQPSYDGNIFQEVYTYDNDYTEKMLRMGCERLIEFLEEHRNEITNQKVFGGLEH